MFGTLVYDTERKEPTFVENPDPAAALSRNRHEKRHVSCEYCRARKVRCSGQPTGCDRCRSVSVKCRYPLREERRRKHAANKSQVGNDVSTTGLRDLTPSKKVDVREVDQLATSPTMKVDQDSRGLAYSHVLQEPTPKPCEDAYPLDSSPPREAMDQWVSLYWTQQQHPQFSGVMGQGLGKYLPMATESFLNTSQEPMFSRAMDLDIPVENGRITGLEDAEAWASDRSRTQTPNDLVPPLVNADPDLMSHLEGMLTPISTTTQPANDLSAMGRLPNSSSKTPIMAAKSPVLAAAPASSGGLYKALPARAPKSSSCHSCEVATAHLLEELDAESTNTERAGLDVLMGHFRQSLSHCSEILDCEWCSAINPAWVGSGSSNIMQPTNNLAMARGGTISAAGNSNSSSPNAPHPLTLPATHAQATLISPGGSSSASNSATGNPGAGGASGYGCGGSGGCGMTSAIGGESVSGAGVGGAVGAGAGVGNNMQLAMAAQYMSTICERMATSYAKFKTAEHERKTQHRTSKSRKKSSGGSSINSLASNNTSHWADEEARSYSRASEAERTRFMMTRTAVASTRMTPPASSWAPGAPTVRAAMLAANDSPDTSSCSSDVDDHQEQQEAQTSAAVGAGAGGGAAAMTSDGRQEPSRESEDTPVYLNMWFSSYHIRSHEERLRVLHCLLAVQFSEFSRVLHGLKARLSSRRGHLVLVDEAERKFEAARSLLNTCSSETGVHGYVGI